MKNNLIKLLSLLLTLCMLVGALVACELPGGDDTDDTSTGTQTGPGELIDYVAELKFDENSGRVWTEATVKIFVDGDTTHFNVPTSVSDNGTLKARYLAINTPESTGKIEAWGKKASNYTKNALQNATSIIIESDNSTWNLDSTGDRHLVWVWYKTAEMTDYRNLNIEILQAGLSVASNSSDNCYGTVCQKVLTQAMAHKLYVFSKEKDPDFYYGSARPITLKELKTNIEAYKDTKVSFEGVVVNNVDNTAYIEEYDEETGMYFGIQVYYHYNLDYNGLEILTVGNRVLIVGSVQYYETGGTYQIADITYHSMRPTHEDNIQKISDGHTAAYQELTAKELTSGEVTLEITSVDEDGVETTEDKTYDIGFLAMHGSAELKNLTIVSTYTTSAEDSSNKGAISITCTAEDGTTVVIRTAVLRDKDGNVITADVFPKGAVISSARGIVDVYDGKYQLKVYSIDNIILK